MKKITEEQSKPRAVEISILASRKVKCIIMYMDKPPIIENVAPKLLVMINKILAKKQKTGYPGKCGCKLTML